LDAKVAVPLLPQLRDVVAIMELAMVLVDFLPVGANEALLAVHLGRILITALQIRILTVGRSHRASPPSLLERPLPVPKLYMLE